MPGASELPQSPQNLEVVAFSAPHYGQRSGNAPPHCEQNFLAAGFGVPQCGQSMVGLSIGGALTRPAHDVRARIVLLSSLTLATAPSRISPASAQSVTNPNPI
jgi:hypothetical protein